MPQKSKGVSTSFIDHATVAASALKQISEVDSIPYVKVVAGVSLLIFETFQSVRNNKVQCAALVKQIDELLCIVIDLCVERTVALSPLLLDAMAKFAETLQKIESFMRTQQDMGRFARFFRQQENATQLEECKTGLSQALDAFSIKINLAVIGDLIEMRAALERKHRELITLISESYASDQDSSIVSLHAGSLSTSSMLSLKSSLSSLSLLLPSAPQIFHGRESELNELTGLLLQGDARVAILGPGGMGKTTLVRSVLHHPDVVAKYRDRWFVSCDSAGSMEDLAFAVASALGLELSGRLSKAIVNHLSSKSSCLLVLDNFETPWEPAVSRSEVEEFLSVLADVPHVALVVTMRGQERPEKIRWSRPFIPPLKPLHHDAAHKIFMDIADADSDEETADVGELLSLTGNLPLAVTLIATVASFDGCRSVLTRWKIENVSLLSDGWDKESNLEISLRMSLSSPRMSSSAGAVQLLSLLSLLPDGISDFDLFNSSIPVPELPQAKSTLLRTSLAYMDSDRLKVLAPVRELVRRAHPPSYATVRPLRLHFQHLFKLWRTYEMPCGDLVQRLAGNAGNLTSMLKYGLDIEAPDLKELVYDIFHLDSFTSRNLSNRSPLMEHIAEIVERADDNQLRGYNIWYLFNRQKAIEPSKASELIARGCRFHQLAGDLMGESRLQSTVASFYIRLGDINQASIHADLAFSLADRADSDVHRHHALCGMARCKRLKGAFREALEIARRAQWFAGRIGNFQRETDALEEEAQDWIGLGNFSQAVDICARARQLIIAGGLEGTSYDIDVLDLEADIYLTKTAYVESRRTYELLRRHTSRQKFPLYHGNSLMTIASIDVALGVFQSEAEVVVALEIPRQIFTSSGYLRGLPICDRVVADFLMASKQTQEAVTIYEKCARSFRGQSVDSFSACVLKLGDIALRNNLRSTTHWATSYLAYGKLTGSASVITWAFRLLGDVFLNIWEQEMSYALFQVALEEFTRMDIYVGKAQCLKRLAEIEESRGELIMAGERFSKARRMFLKSGLVREADRISST